jgi:hypothetical protein
MSRSYKNRPCGNGRFWRKADVGETRTFGSPSALMGYARQAVVAVERRCDYQLTMSNDRT